MVKLPFFIEDIYIWSIDSVGGQLVCLSLCAVNRRWDLHYVSWPHREGYRLSPFLGLAS